MLVVNKKRFFVQQEFCKCKGRLNENVPKSNQKCNNDGS